MATSSDTGEPTTAGNADGVDRVSDDVTVAVASSVLEGETGDEVFNRLVLPEVDVMWRVALSLTRNRADAEDLVQESLLRAYKAIHTFDGRYPRAWLLTIVRNTERNRHRRRRPELLSDPNIAEERGPATEPDEIERRAEDHEFDAAVTNALAELPENFRRVVELVDVDGLTYQEAADVLDVPLGTVMSRLHRARRRIRDLLVPLGFGPGPVRDRALGDDDDDGGDVFSTLADPTTLGVSDSTIAGEPYVADIQSVMSAESAGDER